MTATNSGEERRREVADAIARLVPDGSRFRPVQQTLLLDGMAIAKLYSDLSVPDRQLVSANLGSSIRKKLLQASGRMAEEAMNDGDRRWIQIAAVLNVIEGFEVDYRENFRCMVLVRHAARYLGVDMAEVVEFAMTLASGQSKQQLEIFVSRDDTQNRIEKVEVGVERIDGRWRFVPKSR